MGSERSSAPGGRGRDAAEFSDLGRVPGSRTRRRSDGSAGRSASRAPPEAHVAGWWRNGELGRVVTLDGRELQMLYPGRPAPGSGPDFRDAVLMTPAGELVRGDVEVHVRRSDWRAHGHHLDSRYERVVLHLFLSGHDASGAGPEPAPGAQEVRLDAPPSPAMHAPRAALHGRGGGVVAAPLQRLLELPRRRLEQALDEAGDRRFLRKAGAMLALMRKGDSEDVLYSSLLEALGYSRNRAPMLRLARGLPLAALRPAAGNRTDSLSLEALLLGAAGLLPHLRGPHRLTPEGAERAAALADVWTGAGLRPVVAAVEWERVGIRPQNAPVRRLAGAGVILARHWREGLQNALRRLSLEAAPAEIRQAFQAMDENFWAAHLDFHLPAFGAPALVGAGRAGEILVNVLLPHLYASAHLAGDGALRRRAMQLFRDAPPSPDNEVTREVKALIAASKGGRPVVNSARRQQGLIHVYRALQGRVEPRAAAGPRDWYGNGFGRQSAADGG